MWRDLLAARELAGLLLVRDIRAQNRQTALGILWAFIPPLFAALILTMARNAKFLNIGDTGIPYPVYVVLSLALWGTFEESLGGHMGLVLRWRSMIAKARFAHEALMIAKFGETLFNVMVRSVPVIFLFIWFRVPVAWTVVFAPLFLLLLIALGTAVGLILAPVGALYHDVLKAMGLLMRAWFFLTPVIYPVPQQAALAWVVRINPVTPLMVGFREVLTVGTVSCLPQVWIVAIATLLGLLLAWWMFRLAMPFVVERLSS